MRRAVIKAGAALFKVMRRSDAPWRPGFAKLFGHAPKAPFEIRTIEEFRERSAPSQYWSAAPDGSRPGIFYVNAAGIETNPRAASEPLYLHEAVPGHHFQISLQQEREDLPRFQRFADYNAFIEGWALYAESLGRRARTLPRTIAILQPAQFRAVSRRSSGRRCRAASQRLESRASDQFLDGYRPE